ncbi:hypothetical protein KIL84_015659 [Mauremys mutica]|uniref:Uncharacterized protein n=1 Tax=Mauremys mutica TaxID=74926 RepID=A0A9D3WSR4_9SAUR|nr:hypothetical protein KIL84_015659 [Mauremys mutica]
MCTASIALGSVLQDTHIHVHKGIHAPTRTSIHATMSTWIFTFMCTTYLHSHANTPNVTCTKPRVPSDVHPDVHMYTRTYTRALENEPTLALLCTEMSTRLQHSEKGFPSHPGKLLLHSS